MIRGIRNAAGGLALLALTGCGVNQPIAHFKVMTDTGESVPYDITYASRETMDKTQEGIIYHDYLHQTHPDGIVTNVRSPNFMKYHLMVKVDFDNNPKFVSKEEAERFKAEYFAAYKAKQTDPDMEAPQQQPRPVEVTYGEAGRD